MGEDKPRPGMRAHPSARPGRGGAMRSMRAFGGGGGGGSSHASVKHIKRPGMKAHPSFKTPKRTNSFGSNLSNSFRGLTGGAIAEGDDGESDEEDSDEDDDVHVVTQDNVEEAILEEKVTRGFFKRKTRSIKWYAADIDKVDRGEQLSEEEEEESSDEEEEDKAQAPPPPPKRKDPKGSKSDDGIDDDNEDNDNEDAKKSMGVKKGGDGEEDEEDGTEKETAKTKKKKNNKKKKKSKGKAGDKADDDDGLDEEMGIAENPDDFDDDDIAPHVVDTPLVAFLRGVLMLPKRGEEITPIKRMLRFLTILTLLCDTTAAIVSLVQFEEVTRCCGRPILNMGSVNIDWPLIIKICVYLYIVLIVVEIYPVVRKGFPFNLVNPMIGFLISFALFFDDSYREAIIMWTIECCAVLSEFLVYQVKIRQVNLRAQEIKDLMPKTTQKQKRGEDKSTYLRLLHKNRRKYYVLKQEQRMDQHLLQYLHVAVFMNIAFTCIVLVLILVLRRTGGLCIRNGDYPNPFMMDQLGDCQKCENWDSSLGDFCEVCGENDTEQDQCYYPYS